MVAFFGAKGDQQLDLKHFAAICAALHAELVRLEFAHYDHTGQVCGLYTSVHAPVFMRTGRDCDACLTHLYACQYMRAA